MKKLKASLSKKLKGTAGESLAEVLIALLIAALALTMLASVITTAARIITQSKQKMSEYYTKNDTIALRSASGDDLGEWTVTVKDASDSSVNLVSGVSSIAVEYYVNDTLSNLPVVAFWKAG